MSNESSNFSELFEQSCNVNMKIQRGDKVTGTVIQIGKDTIFVDLGGRQDGCISRKDFVDAEGNLTVKEGDEITAYVTGSDSDGIKLERSLGGRTVHEVDSAVADAYQNKMPIEGKVTAVRKKEEKVVGYAVQIAKSEGFCPASQIDGPGLRRAPDEYLNQTYRFLITEYSEDGFKLVVSRRAVLEDEAAEARQRLLANLEEGMVLDGTVTSIQPYGCFVDLGGVEGMVHVSELSWNRGVKVEEIVKVGAKVRVKVLSYEPPAEGRQRPRVSLSIKQATKEPWADFMENPAFAVGTKHTGKVARLVDFGAFIQLLPGVEGLAHISQLGADHRVEHPSEVLKEGQEVEVTILEINEERHRVSLCVGEPKVRGEKAAELTDAQEQVASVQANLNETLEGEVESQKPFGLFVKLPNGQTGLLHISQLNLGGDGMLKDRIMYRKYPLHSKINVIVKEVSGNRISLTLPETLASENESAPAQVVDEKAASFGTLGDLFGGLKL
ncbi:MAG: S1 RNA-binding domain-containing protein [Victivallales bacterium]|nr:S1 RNA-binding domain-containing protein [Victivallales bacterium]